MNSEECLVSVLGVKVLHQVRFWDKDGKSISSAIVAERDLSLLEDIPDGTTTITFHNLVQNEILILEIASNTRSRYVGTMERTFNQSPPIMFTRQKSQAEEWRVLLKPRVVHESLRGKAWAFESPVTQYAG